MRKFKLETVIADVDRVLDFARTSGLSDDVATSRFVEYRTRLECILAARGGVSDDAGASQDEPDAAMRDGIARVESIELAGLVHDGRVLLLGVLRQLLYRLRWNPIGLLGRHVISTA